MQNRIQTAMNSFMARNSKGSQKMVLGHIEMVKHGNKIYMRNLRSGEAGEFPVDEVAAIVAKYFSERF